MAAPIDDDDDDDDGRSIRELLLFLGPPVAIRCFSFLFSFHFRFRRRRNADWPRHERIPSSAGRFPSRLAVPCAPIARLRSVVVRVDCRLFSRSFSFRCSIGRRRFPWVGNRNSATEFFSSSSSFFLPSFSLLLLLFFTEFTEFFLPSFRCRQRPKPAAFRRRRRLRMRNEIFPSRAPASPQGLTGFFFGYRVFFSPILLSSSFDEGGLPSIGFSISMMAHRFIVSFFENSEIIVINLV